MPYEIIHHAGVGDSVYKAIFLEIKVTERDPRSDKNMLRIFLTFGLLPSAQQLIFSFHPNALSLSAEKGGRLRKFTLT
jgi:hypothetical protein